MANRLADEKSLYLKQHADNPVDWYPWGEAALERARKEDKPLLVSIGYSACHWCHVMAHESFENEYIAGLMNKHFVCVKVDREERPDLDQIYMEAVQMIARHGGWPLNAFCLPDGRPFFGGTYFPPEDKGNGMIPWPQLLMRVSDYYRRERDKLEENADNVVHNLQAMNTPILGGQDVLNEQTLRKAAEEICLTHDDDFGGFGEAPKFPPAMSLNFLLEVRRTADLDQGLSMRLDQVVKTSLSAMAHGGLFDQIGGGFARYSVDRYWLIPHFEKMLYDNALLLDIYTKAWQRYRHPLFQAVVEETVGWAQREMHSPDGLFFSSLDADSEGKEGKFYVWKPNEISDVLGEEEGRAFCVAYNITAEGNFEDGYSNPALTTASFEERQKFAEARQKLLDAREKRPRPGRDEKRLLSWNSLFIKAIAEAAFTFNCPDWFAMASRAANSVWETMRFDENRLHSVHDGTPRLNGYLDDYAFFAEALLALASRADFFEPGTLGVNLYAKRAETLADSVLTHFGDTEGIGFFFTSDDHEKLAARRKEWWDNAISSGNSALLHVFVRLHAVTGDQEYEREFTRLKRAYPGLANRAPNAIVHALCAIASESAGIGVIKVKGETDWPALADFIRTCPWQPLFVFRSDDAAQPEGLQLCIGQTCRPPVKNAADLDL